MWRKRFYSHFILQVNLVTLLQTMYMVFRGFFNTIISTRPWRKLEPHREDTPATEPCLALLLSREADNNETAKSKERS